MFFLSNDELDLKRTLSMWIRGCKKQMNSLKVKQCAWSAGGELERSLRERGRERSCGLFSLDVCLFYVINVLRGRVCFQDPVQLIWVLTLEALVLWPRDSHDSSRQTRWETSCFSEKWLTSWCNTVVKWSLRTHVTACAWCAGSRTSWETQKITFYFFFLFFFF